MTISAILFDFDGTLVESLDVKIAAFASLYAHHGREVERAAVEHYRANSGVSRLTRIRHCHEQILGDPPSEEAVQRLGDAFGALVEDQVVASDWVPGAHKFLDAHAGKLPLFIASATPREELARIIAKRRMEHYFEGVFGSPPDKTVLIQEIIAGRELDPDRVVMVGDGRADYDAAVANGVRFVGRLPAGHPNPFPEDAVVVADLSTLGDHLCDGK